MKNVIIDGFIKSVKNCHSGRGTSEESLMSSRRRFFFASLIRMTHVITFYETTIILNLILLLVITGCANKASKAKNESDVETTVVNITKDSYDVYIGRGRDNPTNMLTEGIKPGEEGWLGNPHPIGWCGICRESHTRAECIEKFKQDFYVKINYEIEFRKAVLALKGKRLGCYCKPKACHGDVIKEWIESQKQEYSF